MKRSEEQDRVRHGLQNLAFAGTLVVLALVLYAAAIARSAERRERREAATQTAQARVAATIAGQATAGAVATATVRHEEAYRSTPIPVTPQEPIAPETAGRVQPLARWGMGVPSAVAYAPDGRYLALGTTLGVYLYDPEGTEPLRLIETDFPVQHLAFSQTGDRLALGLLDGSLWLWSADDGHLRPLADDLGSVVALVFPPKGKVLAAGHSDSGSSWLWQEGLGVILELRPPAGTAKEPMPLPSVAFSGDGRYVGVGWYEGPFQLWDVAERRVLGELAEVQGFQRIAFSPDGSLLATASGEGTVRVWRLPLLTPLGTFETSMGYLNALVFSPNGGLLASAGQRTVRVWDVRNTALLRILEMPRKEASRWPMGDQALAFSPRGTALVGIATDGNVLTWDLASGTAAPLLLGFTPAWVDTAVTPDGQLLAALADDGRVWIWSVADGTLVRVLEPVSWASSPRLIVSQYVMTSSLAQGPLLVLPETQAVRVGERTFTMTMEMPYPYLWPTTTVTWVGQATTTLSFEGGFPPRILPLPDFPGISFLLDGRTLGVRAFGEGVTLWDATSGRLLGWLLDEIPSAETFSERAVLSPDQKWIAAPGEGGTVLLRERGPGSQLRTLAGHEDWVTGIAFSSDGRYLATGSADGTVLLRRASDDFLSYTIVTREPVSVSCVAFSPDASLLALGRIDGTVRLIDTATFRPVADLRGHTVWVSDLTFAADGRWLLTVSLDGALRLWGVVE
ncbi:MAG: WD40 repeat domain-containing protein [Chloroflexia bacterium]